MRRLHEQYGERGTIRRAAERVLRSMIDWGALRETGQPGIYEPAMPQRVTSPSLGGWLLEALLHAREKSNASYASLVASPALFPFEISALSPVELERGGRIVAVHRGFDGVVVALSA